jgi:hypothetical protein
MVHRNLMVGTTLVPCESVQERGYGGRVLHTENPSPERWRDTDLEWLPGNGLHSLHRRAAFALLGGSIMLT